MRKSIKKAFAVLCAVSMAVTLFTGCGNVNPNKTVATIDGVEVKLGVVNFAAKYQQAMYESMYSGMLGSDMWQKDLYGNGKTFAANVTEDVMNEIKEMYILDIHKDEYNVSLTDAENEAIEKAALQFIDDNSSDAQGLTSGSKETVTEFLRLYTVSEKVKAAIKATADATVTEDEAAQRTFEFIKFANDNVTDVASAVNDAINADNDKDVQAVTDSSAASEALLEKVNGLRTQIDEGADMKTVADENDGTYLTYSYGKDELDKQNFSADVIKAADELEEGQLGDVVAADDGVYIIRLTKAFDEEATETRKKSLAEEKKNAKYTEVYTAWLEDTDYVLDEKVLAEIDFRTPLTLPAEEESSAAN